MKTKILITTIALGLFTISTIQAQEKKQDDMKHDDMKHEHMDMAKDKTIYTCSMHPEVKTDKPDECPKCGMKLKKIEMKRDKAMAKTYTCSMHPEVKSDKPDECPKCGMKMVEKKMDMKKKKDKNHNEHKH
jgi:predicted RNA-binding Zn-ribbon protein involved in translation (DUF1610 family)